MQALYSSRPVPGMILKCRARRSLDKHGNPAHWRRTRFLCPGLQRQLVLGGSGTVRWGASGDQLLRCTYGVRQRTPQPTRRQRFRRVNARLMPAIGLHSETVSGEHGRSTVVCTLVAACVVRSCKSRIAGMPKVSILHHVSKTLRVDCLARQCRLQDGPELRPGQPTTSPVRSPDRSFVPSVAPLSSCHLEALPDAWIGNRIS